MIRKRSKRCFGCLGIVGLSKSALGFGRYYQTFLNISLFDRESPVVIQMSDYSGFEKVGPLGTSLPVNNSQTTTQAGDIVLYNGDQIVIFYGSNSWSYTRLGHIDDLTGWEDALGSGDVTMTLSLE